MTLLILLAIAVVVAAVLFVPHDRSPDRHSYETMVELHRIRRRRDAMQVKAELRRNAAAARQALQDDLNQLDRHS